MERKTTNILLICVGTVVALAAIYGTWVLLGWYIAPETPTDRKDHVQVMAVGLGAVGAIITAIIGWRNLKQSQRGTERTIENTRQIEEDRAQNDALQKYFEQMGELLTKEKLRSSEKDADVRVLARSQTLTVLQGLSPDRIRILLGFLYESHLVAGDDAIVSLAGANLQGADLQRADLQGAGLQGANLEWADLKGANLKGANLMGADLQGAKLMGADLQGAGLQGANLRVTSLNLASLQGANLMGANLTQADLKGADLQEAYLAMTNLHGTKLEGAHVAPGQLDTCKSLEGATMPDGSKHA